MLKNGTSSKMSTLSLSWKHKNHQNAQIINVKNDKKWSKKCEKRGGTDFGLKTGSRSTPWNRKSAQPGGSENANCQKVPFIWHFGHFEGGSLFWSFLVFFTFLILAFWWFCVFTFCHFFCFSDFVDFHVFVFSGFLINFVDFLLLAWIFDHFCVKFMCLNDDTLFS